MALFDSNTLLVCPKCHRSSGLRLAWSGSRSYYGEHEDYFDCELCNCAFTAMYRVAEIRIEEEEKND